MTSKISKMFYPLLFVEAYLLFTVWLLYFGPVEWPLENEQKFLTYIGLYHVFFIGGYVTFIIKEKTNLTKKIATSYLKIDKFLLRNIWLIIVLALIGSVIFNRNITHSLSYFPKDFFTKFFQGLVDPAGVRKYYASASYANNFVGNKYVTSILLFISVFKYSLLPILIFYWDFLSVKQKVVGAIVLFLPLMSGVSISLSSINFHYIFVMAVSFLVIVFSDVKKGISTLKKRKFFIFSFLFLFFFSFWQFYSVKSGVSPYQVAIQKEKPTSFNYLSKNGIKFKRDEFYAKSNVRKPFLYDLYEKLSVYLDQGYLGYSIALGEKFDSTYGVGHSVFLQRVFDKHFGFNFRSKTYQHKISNRWDEYVQWHSAYSYFANDVGFAGVFIVMFALGFFYAQVFTFAIVYQNIFAKLLLPLLGILFLYLPANNQIFSFLETMSSFWILSLLFWTCFKYKSLKISEKI